jgi:hypothetical protein
MVTGTSRAGRSSKLRERARAREREEREKKEKRERERERERERDLTAGQKGAGGGVAAVGRQFQNGACGIVCGEEERCLQIDRNQPITLT